MKFSSQAVLSVLSTTLLLRVSLAEETPCTHGKLYVSDEDSTNLHVFDLGGSLENMAEETTVTVKGAPGIHLDVSGSGTVIGSIFRGTEADFYADGVVNWVNTEVTAEDHGDHFDVMYGSPSLVENAAFECRKAIHFIRHDGKIGISNQ
jgi:hypothetical protein